MADDPSTDAFDFGPADALKDDARHTMPGLQTHGT